MHYFAVAAVTPVAVIYRCLPSGRPCLGGRRLSAERTAVLNDGGSLSERRLLHNRREVPARYMARRAGLMCVFDVSTYRDLGESAVRWRGKVSPFLWTCHEYFK